jgi:uncharacterized protein YndB with AHSA1/START domain
MKKDVDLTTPDRIEKQLFLRAAPARVWRAISNAREFGTWFEVKLEGDFAPGARIKGRIATPGYDHLTMEMIVEQMVPERLFSYRWHPYAIDPKIDYSGEPTTLVEFHLEAQPGGTQLRIVESGFDQIPLGRRAEAFRMNDGGWSAQLTNIERHVAGAQ